MCLATERKDFAAKRMFARKEKQRERKVIIWKASNVGGGRKQEWVVQKLGNKGWLELVFQKMAKSSTGMAICNHFLQLSSSPQWTKTGDKTNAWSPFHYTWKFKGKIEFKDFCSKNMKPVAWARRKYPFVFFTE